MMSGPATHATSSSPPSSPWAVDRGRLAPLLVVALAFTAVLWTDCTYANRVARLSREGSPAPARDPSSMTGYALGQRQFLGTHERGETYRWIESAQVMAASGPAALAHDDSDTVPTGRPRLMPRLYTAWLAAFSWVMHVTTGDPLPIAVERTALWEPVVMHALAFLAAVLFLWHRHGASAAVAAGLFMAVFPPLTGQFLPGVLTPRTWAILCATYALALALPGREGAPATRVISARSACAAGLALALEPSIGFPVVLISAVVGVTAIWRRSPMLPAARWSLVGGAVTTGAWFVDSGVWNPAVGELRYAHPAYALAWLGLGLAMDGWQRLHLAQGRQRRAIVEIAAAVPLVSILIYIQVAEAYRGWLYVSAPMRRLTSLDETVLYRSAFEWLARAPAAEVITAMLPAACIAAGLVFALRIRARPERASLLVAVLPWAGAFVLGLVAIRWSVIASLLAIPVLTWMSAQVPPAWRRGALVVASAFLVALLVGARSMPASMQRSTDAAAPGPADLEALVFRHFSHWMATHNPATPVAALAPPELSDSLVFHGGCRVLLSTAWESYPGQVAASRILSAPEASEAEAVIESRGITHVILPSWDPVLPLLVKAPLEKHKDTLHARLDSWILPRFLRPIPYHLPAAPGYTARDMRVFRVTAPQDEALALSRLAEYFVEMDRSEPAALAAKALAAAFADDPNAILARAAVSAQLRDTRGFQHALERLAAEVEAGRSPLDWDRRVQRAIILALGRRHDLAQPEIAACLAEASRESLLDLTPLQARRLLELATRYKAAFPDEETAALAASLSSEYSAPAQASPR